MLLNESKDILTKKINIVGIIIIYVLIVDFISINIKFYERDIS